MASSRRSRQRARVAGFAMWPDLLATGAETLTRLLAPLWPLAADHPALTIGGGVILSIWVWSRASLSPPRKSR